jgi:putative SOS response-associated peptidase YedK
MTSRPSGLRRPAAVLARKPLVPMPMLQVIHSPISSFMRRLISCPIPTSEARRSAGVPASGFYEWQSGQPHYFHPTGDVVFSLAGLYEVRRDAEGQEYKTFCIITTRPNRVAAPIHDRMPAILERAAERVWLDPDQGDPAGLLPLLGPYPDHLMACYATNPLVGNVRNDGPSSCSL